MRQYTPPGRVVASSGKSELVKHCESASTGGSSRKGRGSCAANNSYVDEHTNIQRRTAKAKRMAGTRTGAKDRCCEDFVDSILYGAMTRKQVRSLTESLALAILFLTIASRSC